MTQTQRSTWRPVAPPAGPAKTTTLWATPESRNAPAPQVAAAQSGPSAKMLAKNLLREITPPVLWRLAGYVKRAIR
jgi:hypothetical protein